ncbi:hypothetical protein QYE76_013229 [Lolium multiflorum]|uniref:Uncharacterized protein n=1 Tax=Lolium multiflorum TaxID=4521 RepID=A0AAD8U0Q1_LOLMU|nr:hypothetical protein QYE76_013229 [Lolium multiflorum]
MKMAVKMAVVSMEKPSGHFPVPAACRNRDSCPPDLGFVMAAALEGFSYRGFSAVYTNEMSTVKSILNMYLEWLKDGRYRFVGLDLEYDFRQEKIAVMQIALREHGLVFHLIRTFLKNKGVTFVGVDIRTGHKLLYKQWLYIPPGKHLDLQDMLNIPGYGNRDGMATMSSELIHPKYAGMKEKFVHDYDKFEGHNFWEFKPLSDMNLEYASIDGYVTYEPHCDYSEPGTASPEATHPKLGQQ